MQVGKLSEGSEAWTRTVITIAALVVLGGVVYFTTRPTVVYTQSTPSSPPETVTNTQTVTSRSPVPVPVVIAPPHPLTARHAHLFMDQWAATPIRQQAFLRRAARPPPVNSRKKFGRRTRRADLWE